MVQLLSNAIMKIFGSKPEINRAIRKTSFMETIIFWTIDTNTRKRVNLASWLKTMFEQRLKYFKIPDDLSFDIQHQQTIATEKFLILRSQRWVAENITYETDQTQYKAIDYWAEPDETLSNKKGDCDDGAILLYTLLSKLGVPDERLRIVCGDVIGGGHSYLVWMSPEDGLEYPVDWCYHYPENRANIVQGTYRNSYTQNSMYYNGKAEWFSYNKTSSYVRR